MKDIKYKIQDDIKYSFSSDWISKLENQEHWQLYWYQLYLIRKYVQPDESLLEIGLGTGFTSNYLRSKSYQVTTFDIDSSKNPDIEGNIVNYSFTTNYDYILAFEVFEHLPFEKLSEVLFNLKKTTNKGIIISLPVNLKTWLELSVKTPRFTKVISLRTKRRKIITQNHFWELGFKQYNTKLIINTFRENGFQLTETLHHRHFIYFVFHLM